MCIEEPIGLDSQCLSYLIDAMQGVVAPSGDLAEEKVALFRIYLYTPGTLSVTPHVLEECARMRNKDRRSLHASYVNVLFGEPCLNSPDRVGVRTLERGSSHSGHSDCRILAEAEDVRLTTLLTYDAAFIRRLGHASHVALVRPADYWDVLSIPRGTRPDKLPHQTNPLASMRWWQW